MVRRNLHIGVLNLFSCAPNININYFLYKTTAFSRDKRPYSVKNNIRCKAPQGLMDNNIHTLCFAKICSQYKNNTTVIIVVSNAL